MASLGRQSHNVLTLKASSKRRLRDRAVTGKGESVAWVGVGVGRALTPSSRRLANPGGHATSFADVLASVKSRRHRPSIAREVVAVRRKAPCVRLRGPRLGFEV